MTQLLVLCREYAILCLVSLTESADIDCNIKCVMYLCLPYQNNIYYYIMLLVYLPKKHAGNRYIVAKNSKEFQLHYVVGEEKKFHYARLAVSL